MTWLPIIASLALPIKIILWCIAIFSIVFAVFALLFLIFLILSFFIESILGWTKIECGIKDEDK